MSVAYRAPESDPVASAAVATEAITRASADTAEASARAAGDAADQAAIAAEVVARGADVDDEMTRAEAAEAAEIAARAAAVSAEAASRVAQDAVLAAATSSEATTRATADTALANADAAETSARQAADTAEAAARVAADTAHEADTTNVHGITDTTKVVVRPAMATGHGLLWDGSAWVDTDLATQAELDAFTAQKGAASGLASLGSDSLVTAAQRAATYGTLASRPSAATAGDRAFYFATDDNGGTLYQVQSGAWVKVAASATQASGVELGYGEITSNDTTTNTYPANKVPTGLTATTPSLSGSQPVKVIFDCAGVQNNSTGGVVVQILEGATELVNASVNVAANINIPVHREVRLVPSAGAHTYSAAISRLSAAGTVTLVAKASVQVLGC